MRRGTITCIHTERRHFSLGLCRQCYERKRKQDAERSRAPGTLPDSESQPLESELRGEVQEAGPELRELPALHSGPAGESLPDGPVPDSESGMVPEVQPVDGKRAGYAHQFEDIKLPPKLLSIQEFYYKSECRPLGELHPHYHKLTSGRLTHGRNSFKQLGRKALTFRQWLDSRDRARKDLYWLGKECIGTPESGSGFVEHVHREMLSCFVKKNFDGVYHKGFTLEEVREAIDRQPREKEMLLLCPTGAFKSTANKIDAAQWMLNVPDIRIFIMTGSGALSRKFLREVKGFFHRVGQPTYFQTLFPEYVIEGTDGETMVPMYCPARMCPQPGTPTIWVNSIDGAVAGWHCDIWKGDDIVNEDNSNTEDTRASLKARYDNVSQNRPDRWAFRDHLGTRYDADDWYGSRIEEFRRYPESNALKYLCRAAWTVKAGFLRLPIKQLQEHMVDLYFPEFMPFKLLIAKCRQNERQFRCQQLNEPAGSELAVSFERETIERHTIILNAVPRPANGIRVPVVIWDTAHDSKVQSDYSAGAVGWCFDETRALYVLEVDHGKWKDSETAVHVVDLHWKWNARFTEVEKFHGWELFAAEVQRVSLGKYRKYLPLLWRETDTTSGSKRNRVKGLESLLNADRLWFVEGDWMETLVDQFVRFTGFSKRRKDDIPDAIAGLQRLIPPEPRLVEEAMRESENQRKAREKQELRDKFAAQHTEAAYRTVFQAPPPPPQSEAEPEPVAVRPGPGWIFGRTGIHL